ncbi:hypothetical protein QFZ53_002289 [Microbacterium natoriense]|uniref:Uncharacterized protein n=1 Tax=Microbacterium natoriense TaxID=284570 RepID=A0AAW8EXN6_9MICO|nr:hypothetical protein [Microbacterium natoriense]MDQ0648093.1 hypothetical protein [Microbacterium natoriense]
MSAQFDADRSAAIRLLLIEDVAASAPRRTRPGLVAGLLLVGILTGAGASTAAFAATGGFVTPTIAQPSSHPQPDLPEALEAPPGTTPGAPLISLIGAPSALSVAAPTEYPLAARPDGVTHVRVTVTALTPGSISWGTDADGNNPRATFNSGDIGGPGDTTWYDFPLDDTTGTFFVTPADGLTATVSFQYLNMTPTHLKRNAAGQTYGLDGGPDGVPDLVLVSGVSPEGEAVLGYARSGELNAFSPEHASQPSDPEEALAWQEERERDYPSGWDIPVFESDGTTRIGTFHVG